MDTGFDLIIDVGVIVLYCLVIWLVVRFIRRLLEALRGVSELKKLKNDFNQLRREFYKLEEKCGRQQDTSSPTSPSQERKPSESEGSSS